MTVEVHHQVCLLQYKSIHHCGVAYCERVGSWATCPNVWLYKSVLWSAI